MRPAEEFLKQAAEAEAHARWVSRPDHRDRLLEIAAECRRLAEETAANEPHPPKTPKLPR